MTAPAARRRRIDRETALTIVAERAEAVADGLHAELEKLKSLCDAVLNHIEDLGGDRAHNWDLHADLANAQTALYAAACRARTVARHAEAGK